MKLALLLSTLILLSACSTFSTEKMMKVHQGMSSDEILQLFGKPKSISQAVCGRERPWNCTTWEYKDALAGDRASFTFSGENPNSLILNNFNIDKY